MSEFSVKDLASILEMVAKYELTEFKLNTGKFRVSLERGKADKRAKAGEAQLHLVQQAPVALAHGLAPHSNIVPLSGHMPAPTASATVYERTESPLPPSGAQASPQKPHKEIISPMVGTFYRRPAVDAEPYVQVGDTVKKGDVLCIVEAMKLMNEIESDVAGRVTEICLEDGQMAEYGEVLFKIEPL